MRFVVKITKLDGSTLYMGRLSALTTELDGAEIVSATMGDSFAYQLRNAEGVKSAEVVPVKLQLA